MLAHRCQGQSIQLKWTVKGLPLHFENVEILGEKGERGLKHNMSVLAVFCVHSFVQHRWESTEPSIPV